MISKPGFIYLMKPKGHNVYKIGESIDPPRRLEVQSKKRDYELEIVQQIQVKDCFGIEQALHEQFSRYRLAGEWFVLPEATLLCFCDFVNNLNDIWVAR